MTPKQAIDFLRNYKERKNAENTEDEEQHQMSYDVAEEVSKIFIGLSHSKKA